MKPSIAIVGMACEYPDANSPEELWKNVIVQRRSFRKIPSTRLNLAEYFDPDPAAPDRTYSGWAALIEGYEFDRVKYRISRAAFRSTDLAHWLALDVAARAIENAGSDLLDATSRAATAVYVGNTLTGELSRAASLRLRWPYVKSVLERGAVQIGLSAADVERLVADSEENFKRPFAPVGEDTLAGGLSNTIAGRIANFFNFNGGGYIVDGACASSLLAVSTACSSLMAGDCDVAIAGGVDISLDPFELVGFAKTGALARQLMRVYDAKSEGFWPGEGCGFVVLMREEDARRLRREIHASIRGWGISSDGSGGITRPEVDGQVLALERAYQRAGYGPETVEYFEGHGTGTAVGDATELAAISRIRARSGAVSPAAIGSVKANIGHTKAAAGIAGLIKAAVAVREQVIPPTTGCESPHREMGTLLRAPVRPEAWPSGRQARASVSAMGFGGINVHVTLESAGIARASSFVFTEMEPGAAKPVAELFVFSDQKQIDAALRLAPSLSFAELRDWAVHLAALPKGQARAAVVAETPEELAQKLSKLRAREPNGTPRIGFLFPGQGSQNGASDTAVAQPSIVRDTIAGLKVLRAAGIEADVAVGHSLGEISALFWAGCIDEETAVRIASKRGELMAALADSNGAMAALLANQEETEVCIGDDSAYFAGMNSPSQTVISGDMSAVSRVVETAKARGIRTVMLPVSHAFHSPLVAPAAGPLKEFLATCDLSPIHRRVISTVTGAPLAPDEDVSQLLHRQVTSPVLFRTAIQHSGHVDLWIEVGPGRTLAGMTAENGAPVVRSTEIGGPSRRPLLAAIAAAFELGAGVDVQALHHNQSVRPVNVNPRFFVNPCEAGSLALEEDRTDSPTPEETPANGADPVEVVRATVAEHADLPLSAIHKDSRLLADLHLNSIVVAQVAVAAARRIGVDAPVTPLEFATLSVGQIAEALEALKKNGATPMPSHPKGIADWVRPYEIHIVERPRAVARPVRKLAKPGAWQFFGDPRNSLRSQIEGAMDRLPAEGGVVLCLPRTADQPNLESLFDAARSAVLQERGKYFLVVQHMGLSAAGLARTAFFEGANLNVILVSTGANDPAALEHVLAESQTSRQFSEAYYDSDGKRREPVWRLARLKQDRTPFTESSVVVVTGGGKGIGAECAIELARVTGARLAILGASDPLTSPELNANLTRMATLGIRAQYFKADVTDPVAVARAIGQIRTSLGRPNGLLHFAGVNQPALLPNLSRVQIDKTLRTKVDGLKNLLSALDADELHAVVTFGSIISRIGLAGEAHYALANEWQATVLADWSKAHASCRCLNLDWSVWTGTGMGQRVAHLDALMRAGISPISIDEGVGAFLAALRYEPVESRSLVMTGRFGEPATANLDVPELPLLRFIDRVRVHYPGVELVAEADLDAASDPYLEDHVFSGARVFPGVMALEGMAQAARVLSGTERLAHFERVRFHRPIMLEAGGRVTVRIAAQMNHDGTIDVRLRSSETSFSTDHMEATCRFNQIFRPTMLARSSSAQSVVLDPQTELYGSVLFQSGRFRRLKSYERLGATECLARASVEKDSGWFGRYLPQSLVLSDPGARDAALHAIQACIPHARVLPVGVDSVEFGPHRPGAFQRIHARELSQSGGVLVYDLDIATPDGQVVERWSRLELRVIDAARAPSAWSAALLGPYLQRRVGETLNRAVGVEINGAAPDWYRADGKPLVANGHISRTHISGLTLQVRAQVPVGCDCEPVVAKTPADWRGLLGSGGFALAELLSAERDEDLQRSATRVWCAIECVKKAGLRADARIDLADAAGAIDHDWIVLGSGTARIATTVVRLSGAAAPAVVAVLVGA